MTGSPSLYVVDASVWIDLENGGLLTAVFALRYQWIAPDVILHELSEATRGQLRQSGLDERELSGPEVLEVSRLTAVYRQLSAPDLFALVLARSLGIGLLTGDQRLRRAAIQEGVVAHGLLWLLDELVAEAVVSPHEAATRLEQMLKRGARLPVVQVEERLIRWKGTPKS